MSEENCKEGEWAFDKYRGQCIKPEEDRYEEVVNHWCAFIKRQSRKGLIPLFITGSGASMGENGVPSLTEIVGKLKEEWEKIGKQNESTRKIAELFKKYEDLKKENIQERTIIASILNNFQENRKNRDIWNKMNNWLLKKIIDAEIPTFYKDLASLYKNDDINATSLTLNFDGLLIRQLLTEKKRAFSLPDEKECEAFFLRTNDKETQNYSHREYIEIQARGDILYVSCQSKKFCPNQVDGKQYSLWAHVASLYEKNGGDRIKLDKEELIRCPQCGEEGVSYLSFPGSYVKERDMQKMISVVWKYLAFRVSCVTVVGLSGTWDPLIIAFLGDLLSERNIPLCVVKPRQSKTHIIKELVIPALHRSIWVNESADDFSKKIVETINRPKKKFFQGQWDDTKAQYEYYWVDLAQKSTDGGLSNLKPPIKIGTSEIDKLIYKHIESSNLGKFAQIGMKSYWLGLLEEGIKNHNRLNHSVGVMYIATYMYDLVNPDVKNKAERQFLRIAALLHDLGHLPFSHLIEDVFNELNWRPGRYQTKYSHLLQTEKNIRKLFESEELNKCLEDVGYSVNDIVKLVNGCFGVGYLDAILNSPIDADKVDYIFRDTHSTKKKITISPKSFLDDISNGMFITPEKYLAFSKNSAKAVRDLLNTRLFIYKELYLKSGIIILEGIVKLIIKTYFVYMLKLEKSESPNFPNAVREERYSDLGDHKIHYCISKLLKIVAYVTSDGYKEDSQNNDFSEGLRISVELRILFEMFKAIREVSEKEILNKTFFKRLEDGFRLICDINRPDGLAIKSEVEPKIIQKEFYSNRNIIKDIIKTVKLRIPGAAIIESIRPPSILSIAEGRSAIKRSDGTEESSECIIVPAGKPDMWNVKSKAEKPLLNSGLRDDSVDTILVYFFPLSGDVDDDSFQQSLNLFEKLVDNRTSQKVKGD